MTSQFAWFFTDFDELLWSEAVEMTETGANHDREAPHLSIEALRSPIVHLPYNPRHHRTRVREPPLTAFAREYTRVHLTKGKGILRDKVMSSLRNFYKDVALGLSVARIALLAGSEGFRSGDNCRIIRGTAVYRIVVVALERL